MSLLSFADVILFLFIVVRGTYIDLKYLWAPMIKYIKFVNNGADSKNSVENKIEHVYHQSHDEDKELEKNEDIKNIYVSIIHLDTLQTFAAGLHLC